MTAKTILGALIVWIFLPGTYLACQPSPADFLPPIPDGVYQNPFGRLITYTQLRDRVVANGRLVEGNPEDMEAPLYYEFEHAGVTYGAVIDTSAVSICPQSEGLGRCWQVPFFVVQFGMGWYGYHLLFQSTEHPQCKFSFFGPIAAEEEPAVHLGMMYRWECKADDGTGKSLVEYVDAAGKAYYWGGPGAGATATEIPEGKSWALNPELIPPEFERSKFGPAFDFVFP